jgi:phage FluMu protein Com
MNRSQDEVLDFKEGLKLWKRIQSAKVCDKCGAELSTAGLSFFSSEVLCPKCKEAEKSLPEYAMEARQVNEAAKASKPKRRRV